MNYKKLNNYTGWLAFLISTIVYFLTIEDTVSLWDCGEYITAAYKLEVGHPPGAPLFMLLGRMFSFFADPTEVAVWINRMSALSSSFTILFMFWSITMLAKKIALKENRTLTNPQIIAIIGSGFMGSMAYTFTDSFWFSAVEGEVYAMSSLFTAITFWAMMKWDEEMDAKKFQELDTTINPNRWMIFIMFMFGLAIGVHLLGLLVVPAIAYVVYFNMDKDFSWKGFFITGILSIFILGFIQEGIIPGTISLASKFEINFVNGFGLPFYSGAILFFGLLIGLCVYFMKWSKKKNKPLVNLALLGFIVFLIGYGSFATIVIRSNANTPLDENDPENLVTLHSYLKREQYGSWPIVSGPYWNSNLDEDQSNWGDRSKTYARRFVVTRADKDLKGFRNEKDAQAYAKKKGAGYEVIEKYYHTNDGAYENQEPAYSQTTIFPRMFWSQDEAKVNGYKSWSGYDANGDDPSAEKGNDGKRLPTFGENLRYFAHYQVDWMYFRYFMWNFAGRQNDIQGHGDNMRGNWKSGIAYLDNNRLGDQAAAPNFTKNNPSNNSFYLLPLIIGLIGMIFHFYKAPKDAFVVLLTFFFTGLAIVVYLNQKPFEPRERDYAYAASFYAFAMWIGLGVYALFHAMYSLTSKSFKGIGTIAGLGLLVCLVCDGIFAAEYAASLTWIIILLIGSLIYFGAHFVGKVVKNESGGAMLSTIIVGIVPFILAVQGWDDHDRSNKTTARDLAHNYLESCSNNAILFTNGDNDTFPLWYYQEVEGKRTDVRVCNLSLMQTDWYTEQMMMKAYDSDPLPIKFTDDQIMMYAGNTDQVYLFSTFDMVNLGVNRELLLKFIQAKIDSNPAEFASDYENLRSTSYQISMQMTSKDATNTEINGIRASFANPKENLKAEDVTSAIDNVISMLRLYGQGVLEGNREYLMQLEQYIKAWDKNSDFLPIDFAMDFVRNDENQIFLQGRNIRFFPSKGFILNVNKENAKKSGVVAKTDANKINDKVKFTINKQAITRENVMMLDVIANNNWERDIYFSSPGGSDISMALYMSGYIKQHGVVYAFTPIKDQNIFDTEKMVENLMNKFAWGEMNKGVLTDYYARRHTDQYRDQFTRVADALLREVENVENQQKMMKNQLASMKAAGQGNMADSLQKSLDADLARVKNNKKIAISLVKKSLEVMPISKVIDYGEPKPGRTEYEYTPGLKYDGFDDGNIHQYVAILFRAGDKQGGLNLGKEVAAEIASILNYFEKNNGRVALKNKMDLVAAMDNYMFLTSIVSDMELGAPVSALAKTMKAKVQSLYQTTIPGWIADLKAEDRKKEAESLKEHLDAIGIKYQFVEKPAVAPAGGQGGQGMQLTPEQIQMMMEQQGQ